MYRVDLHNKVVSEDKSNVFKSPINHRLARNYQVVIFVDWVGVYKL